MSYATGRPYDADTHAINVVDYAHHEIHSGNHYVISHSTSDIGNLTSPNDAIAKYYQVAAHAS
jgi:hypothetical protein